MVARGDMGVEIDYKSFKNSENAYKKPCSMERSLLLLLKCDSMISKPRPTRAEISDVANAIYDRTSAVMLSGDFNR